MTILLTGGSGFLGSHIAARLSHEGHNVRALVRPTSDISFLETLCNVEIIQTNSANKKAVMEAAEGVDGIIHAAACIKAVSERDFYKTNVGYTEILLDAAESAGSNLKRFVLVSSLAALGPSPTRDIIRNDKPPCPITRYGRSKLAAEQASMARSDRIPITIIRPVGLYGPRDKATLMFFKCVQNRIIPYMGNPNTKVMLLYGPDCASACIHAIDAEVLSGSAYLIDSLKPCTQKELYATLERAFGKKALIRFPLPKPVIIAAASILDIYSRLSRRAFMFSRDRLRELFTEFVTDGKPACLDLNWKPATTLEEGLKITLKWYRTNGKL